MRFACPLFRVGKEGRVARQGREGMNAILNLLTTKQVAERLNVPSGTLRYWRKMGVGPAWVKLEGTIRYNSSDVDEYVRRNTRQPSVRAHVEEQRVHL